MTEECKNPVGYFGNYDRIHKIAERYACSVDCPCAADKTLWPTEIQSRLITNMTTGIKNLQQCAPYQAYVKAEGLDFDSTLGIIEKYFDCSGICTKSVFYALTDITHGPPTKNCVDAINDYVTSYSSMMAGISITVGLLLTLGVVGSMIVICCISRKIKITAVTTYKYEILEDNIIM